MRLVLVRLSALGDIVHTWPLAVALKNARPDLQLTWVVEEPLRILVEGHPAVDHIVIVSTRRWRRSPFSVRTRTETASVRSRLRAIRADIALDTQGTLKSAWVTRTTQADTRIGLKRPWRRELVAGFAYNETLPGSSLDPHVVATNLALAAAIGQSAPETPPVPDGSWLLEQCRAQPPIFEPEGDYAVLLPGAGNAMKVMDTDTLVAVAMGLAASGLHSLVAWGPGEHDRAEAVVGGSGGAATLAPATDLAQLTILLGNAKLVIGGDTGPVHLAASLGTPTVGVFLATDWRRNGPLGPSTAIVSAASLPPRVIPNSARAHRNRNPTASEIVAAGLKLLSPE